MRRFRSVFPLFACPLSFAGVAALVLLATLASSDGAAAQRLSIEGRVWEDLNGDGGVGPEERALSGVEVRLFRGDRRVDRDETDAEGFFRFRGLRADNYRLEVDESTLSLDLERGQGSRIYADVTRSIDDANFGFVPREVAERLRREREGGGVPPVEGGEGTGAPPGTSAGSSDEEPAAGGGAGEGDTPEPSATPGATGDPAEDTGGAAGAEDESDEEEGRSSLGLWIFVVLVLVLLAILAKRLGGKPAMTLERFLAHRDAGEWAQMEAAYHALPESVRATSFVRQQRAFGLNRAGDGEAAERLLRELHESEGPSPETCGMLGRVFKDRWEAARDAGDAARAAELLETSIGHYLDGHKSDPSDPYPGINALTLMESLPEGHGRRDSLLAEVRQAVAERTEPDYWTDATRLELAILEGDPERGTAALAASLGAEKTAWQVETTRRNLRLLREGREAKGASVPEWAGEAEEKLGR